MAEVDLGIAPSEHEIDLGIATVEPESVIPVDFQKESQARQLTAHVLANESGLDPNDVITNYDNITEQLYGQKNMTPQAVLGRMEKDGIVVTPQKIDEDILSIAESIGAGKPIDPDTKRRAQSAFHNSNVKFAREGLYAEDAEILKLAEGKPAMRPVGEITSMPVYSREDLLDGNRFASLVVTAPTKQDIKELLLERHNVFNEVIRDYDTGRKDEIAANYAKQQTGFLPEFGKAAKKTTASIGAGALGMIPKEVQPELAELKDVLLDYIKSPDLTSSDTSSAMNFIGRSTGSVIPYTIAALGAAEVTGVSLVGIISTKLAQALGAGTVAYATVGEEAKQNALDSGASEQAAEKEKMIVGGASAVLMAVQVDKLLRFAKPTAQKALQTAITTSTKKAMKQSGGRLTKEVLALGINGGITTAAQEGFIIGVPAYLRDDYPKTPDGNPDWFAMGTQMTEAGAGGAFANIIVGGGFRSFEAARTAHTKNMLARVIAATENIDYAGAKKAANNIIARQLDGISDFDTLYKEEVGKYRLQETPPEKKPKIAPQWATVDEALAAEGLLKPLVPGSKESQRAAEIRGQYSTTVPHTEKLPDKFIEDNMVKVKPPISGKIVKLTKNVGKGVDFLMGEMQTRADNISSAVGRRIREYTFGVSRTKTNWINGVTSFLEKVHAIEDVADRRKIELAARNLSEGSVDEVVQKYGLEKEYQQYRATMDDVYNSLKTLGVDLDYRRAYFPLSIKDVDGLLEFLQTTEKHSLIAEAIERKKAKQGGRPLSEEQKVSLINSMLRGYNSDAISLTRPGFAKERTLGVIDKNIEQFLHDWDASIIHYLERAATTAEQRRFFGKQSKEIIAARKQVEALETRIYKLKNEPQIDEKRLKAASKKRNELQDAYEILNDAPIDESIAAEVKDLVDSGKLNSKQQTELQGILQGIFNKKPEHWVSMAARRWTYIDILNNVTQFLTQMGDLSFPIYRAPKQFPKAFGKALAGKSDITIQDIYVHPLGPEWMDSGLGSFAEKLMFAIRKGDIIGKETYINSLFENYRVKLNKNPTKEQKRLEKFFGEETTDVIADLKAGKVTDNVKYLLASELSGIQPISLADMPEGYAKAGNWRAAYMLKSFMLKRLDFMRTEAFSLMKDPIHKPKEFMTGMGRLIWMSTLFTAAGATTDAAKNFIYGKPIEPTDLVVENFLQIFLLSRYTARKAKEGIGKAFEFQLFPTKTIDYASKDLVTAMGDNEDGKGFELVRSIPLIGDILYWRFGEGRRKLEEQTPKE